MKPVDHVTTVPHFKHSPLSKAGRLIKSTHQDMSLASFPVTSHLFTFDILNSFVPTEDQLSHKLWIKWNFILRSPDTNHHILSFFFFVSKSCSDHVTGSPDLQFLMWSLTTWSEERCVVICGVGLQTTLFKWNGFAIVTCCLLQSDSSSRLYDYRSVLCSLMQG